MSEDSIKILQYSCSFVNFVQNSVSERCMHDLDLIEAIDVCDNVLLSS